MSLNLKLDSLRIMQDTTVTINNSFRREVASCVLYLRLADVESGQSTVKEIEMKPVGKKGEGRLVKSL
jgi:hypothetical protein